MSGEAVDTPYRGAFCRFGQAVEQREHRLPNTCGDRQCLGHGYL